MVIFNNNLFRRDNKNKIRHVELFLNEHSDYVKGETFYSITGKTGLYQGKMIPRPLITIDKGKVKRTPLEQATLQYNSLITSYLDKGYKDAQDLSIVNILDSIEVESKVPEQNTDNRGNLKPMLALSWEGVKDEIINKHWLASTKLDGRLMPSKNSVNSVNSEMGIPSQAL